MRAIETLRSIRAAIIEDSTPIYQGRIEVSFPNSAIPEQRRSAALRISQLISNELQKLIISEFPTATVASVHVHIQVGTRALDAMGDAIQ
jgi:hypothetical protein